MLNQTENIVKKEVDEIMKELDSIDIHIYPTDCVILNEEEKLFKHTLTNRSPFNVVCRVKSTSATFFNVDNNVFVLNIGQTYLLEVLRAPKPIKSHRLSIEVLKLPQVIPLNLHHIFSSLIPPRRFRIRYHQGPTWYKAAIELNSPIDVSKYPNIVKIAMSTGLKAQKDNTLHVNELNILQMALSNDIEDIRK